MKWFEDSSSVYLDAILVASKIAEEYRKHLRRLFQPLQQFGVAINTTKCVFGISEVLFLGHLISGKRLVLLPQKVEAIVNFLELRQRPPTIFKYNQFLP